MDRRFEPEFTGPTASSTPLYALAPADFATQYDLGPELNGGVTGTGVTVGIVNESNIDLNVAAAYRSVFGLTVNPVQVVIDGEDPGENSSATEAYISRRARDFRIRCCWQRRAPWTMTRPTF